MVFKSKDFVTGILFPIVSTDCAADKDAINNDNFSSKSLYKQTDSKAKLLKIISHLLK